MNLEETVRPIMQKGVVLITEGKCSDHPLFVYYPGIGLSICKIEGSSQFVVMRHDGRLDEEWGGYQFSGCGLPQTNILIREVEDV